MVNTLSKASDIYLDPLKEVYQVTIDFDKLMVDFKANGDQSRAHDL